MALSTLDGSKTQAHTVCPHCGRSVDTARRSSVVENGLSVFAGLVLVLMLVPLAFIAWKSCSDFLSDKVSHSILYHPLEDWTQ
ncbi:MAG: hypothetical protein ACLP00_25810 [Terracidiphilus sp.]